MRFRKLRIAFSATCLIACVLLIVLWARSYLLNEQPEPSFGHSQVEQFIRDRPGVDVVINREPALRANLEACFEGESTGGRIYWDNREPVGGSSAEHLSAYRNYPALVRVSNRSNDSAVDKCASLMFELYNVQSDKYFDAIARMSVRNQMSKEDYARSMARGEFTAAKETREFFRKHPLSNANIKDDSFYGWLLELPDEFSDYLRFFDGHDRMEFDYLEYFRQSYDRMKTD